MIAYQIRSVQLLNIVRDIKNGTLITDAYFQRNLVWRELHKKDLIKTILDGYPFPLIFISKGEIDVERMISTSCIVDGQQRTNAIISFVNGDFNVDNKYFSEFTEEQKSNFFKYEIPVCELDIKNTDRRVLDIFQRINRTSDSLSAIEKKASEYGASYFMLVCQILCQQIEVNGIDNEDFKLDPNIPVEFLQWASQNEDCFNNFQSLMTDSRIFSLRDASRKINLQYTLNMVATYLGGFYNRNDKIQDYLEIYLEDFDLKDKVVKKFDEVASYYLSLNLNKDSIWFNKANMFSLFITLLNIKKLEDIDINLLSEKLNNFKNKDIFESEYRVAAKEGVNNRKERQLRNDIIVNSILYEIEAGSQISLNIDS